MALKIDRLLDEDPIKMACTFAGHPLKNAA